MPIELKISAKETDDKKQAIIKDLTGIYNPTFNMGGWGFPNITIGDITISTITLSLRLDDGSYEDAPLATLSVYPTLPNTAGTPVYLSAEDFGYGDDSDATFADGIYRLIYNVQNGDGSINESVTEYFVFVQGIACCYRKAMARIAKANCDCGAVAQKDRDIAMYYRMLQGAECCSNLNDIQNYIDILTKLCSDCGCGCS